jgi:hypothetical protein
MCSFVSTKEKKMKTQIVIISVIVSVMLATSCSGVRPVGLVKKVHHTIQVKNARPVIMGKSRNTKGKCPTFSKVIDRNADKRA